MADNSAEIEETKRIGAVAAGRLEAHAASANDQLVKTSNWLNASLLAVNGGGAIAVLNGAEHIGGRGAAGAVFVVGIVFALLSASMIQAVIAKQQGPLEIWIGYWRGVEYSGVRDDESEVKLAAPITIWEKRAWIAPALGWVSGALFVVGAIIAGATYAPPSTPAVQAAR